ncbi:MAG TPA: PEP/pyruvate-binding domain-containing protein [Planctomycetota bacterium]|nr:PEP/pyruvate-binding domain-containing protein [Planctomycetota bacterium]
MSRSLPPALTHVRFFHPGLEAEPAPKDLLGGKGHSLALMSRAGLPVPPGFTITTDVCRRVLDQGGRWIDGLEDEVRRALAWLEGWTGRTFGRGPSPLLVAVRSGAAASMPGMMDTVLNVGLRPELEPFFPDKLRFRRDVHDFIRSFGETVAGVAETVFESTAPELWLGAFEKAAGRPFPDDPWTMLREAISAVFASWNNERAVKYRQRNNVRVLAGTAVTVMAMFPSERSGILFTEDPNRPDAGRMIIEASLGLGEAIVRGHVAPDGFTVDRASGAIVERRINLGETACVTDDQVRDIARLGLQVERFMSGPVDVEWGLSGGELVLLQSRRIRGLEVARAVPELRKAEIARLRALADGRRAAAWVVHNLAETLPAPTPLTWDLVGRRFMTDGFVRFYRDLGFRPSARVAREGFLELVAGRVYADLERSAELFFDRFPLEYELPSDGRASDALLGRPSKFNVRRAGAGFLLKLPWYVALMIRAGRVLRREARNGLKTLTSRTIPDFLSWAAAARAKALDGLSDADVLAELDARVETGLVKYGAEFLKPGFLAGYYHGRLASTLELALGAEEGRALTAALLGGLEGDKTVESNVALYAVARGERTLDDFLAEYGHRAVNELELAEPRWREDAAYVRQRVDQARRATGPSPSDLHARRRVERQSAEASLPGRLAAAGAGALLDDVRADLAGAQAHLPWRETCKHYFLMAVDLVRSAVQVLAERWDLGRDVYFLQRAELGRFGAEREALRATLEERRVRWQAAQKIPVPDVLRASDLEALGREEPLAAAADAYSGLGVASGVAAGRVRVLASPSEAGDLGAGYVLVCPTTDPSWTPLFVNAAAIVVERGGMLSHGAIVARDFGIPAVVLHGATRLLAEGATVKVDGNRGRVELAKA